MSVTVSAGSYVAAVMEMAGYRAQESFLREFRDFFQEAGALIYLLAGVGAVISVVNFGSYRAARYLLIGPALFWFLVTPTYSFNGTLWRIGAGSARGLHRQDGDAKSRADIDRALKDAFNYTGGPVNIAYGFALFVRPINTIISNINGVVLNGEEDRYYRTFLQKGRAYDAVINARPRSPQLVEAIDRLLLTKCIAYIGYGMALGSPEMSRDTMRRLSADSLLATGRRFQDYTTQFENAGRQRADLADEALAVAALGFAPNAQGIAGMWGLSLGPFGPIDAVTMARVQNQTLECREVWRLAAIKLQLESDREAVRALAMARFDGAPQGVACNELMRKLTGEDNSVQFAENAAVGGGAAGLAAQGQADAECLQKLKYITALYVTKNIITDRQGLPRFMMSLLSRMTANGNQGQRTPRAGWRLGANYGTITGLNGSADQALRSINPDDFAVEDIGRQQRHFGLNTRLTVLGGANLATEASFVDFPKYNTRKLAQQLFSWSLNAPWWQGTLLYILGIAYPFLALVVLIPGRAQSFMLLPLAWLWVKMWDVGFAMTMVLERVLWNNIPPLLIDPAVIRPLDQNTFDRVLSEANKVDPIWNIHGYYMVTSAAMLAVPAVTGFVTLKSRRAILASFTDKMLQDVKDKGDAAAGQIQIQAAAGRAQLQHELQNQAIQAMRREPGLEATRALAASVFATGAGITTFASRMRSGPPAERNPGAAGLLAAAEYLRVGDEMLRAYENYDRAYAIQFHPLFGKFGLFGVSYDGEKAGADSSTGFEMEGRYQGDNAAVDALIALHSARVGNMFTLASDVATAGVTIPGGPLVLVTGIPGLFGSPLDAARSPLVDIRADPALRGHAETIHRIRIEQDRRERLANLQAEHTRFTNLHGLNPATRSAPVNARLATLDADMATLRSPLYGRLPARPGATVDEARARTNENSARDFYLPPARLPGETDEALAERHSVILATALTAAQTAYTSRAAELSATLPTFESIRDGTVMTTIQAAAPLMFNNPAVYTNMARAYRMTRGWGEEGPLTPEQERELEGYMAPIRQQFSGQLPTGGTPEGQRSLFLDRIFGLTPDSYAEVRRNFGTGHYNVTPRSMAFDLDPYNQDTFDYFGVPHFVDRPLPEGAPVFPIEGPEGDRPNVPPQLNGNLAPVDFRWLRRPGR